MRRVSLFTAYAPAGTGLKARAPASLSPSRPRGRRANPRALLEIARPRQWIKNGLVVAAAGAAGALGHDDVPVRVAAACVAFCLLASGIYAVNDVRDAVEDRLHPRKRFRPVAAGELSPAGALRFGVGLMVAGLVLCWMIRSPLVLVGGAYVVVTLSYTVIWRHVPILDILAIGGGFVLRAVAGGVAAPVTLSRWFVLVISATAVFVAAAKRDCELRRSAGAGSARRPVLDRYPPGVLAAIMVVTVAVALFAYAVWAIALPSPGLVPWRALTLAPFAICLLRYGARVRAGAAEAPEEVLLSDRPLALAGVVWLILFALAVHAAS